MPTRLCMFAAVLCVADALCLTLDTLWPGSGFGAAFATDAAFRNELRASTRLDVLAATKAAAQRTSRARGATSTRKFVHLTNRERARCGVERPRGRAARRDAARRPPAPQNDCFEPFDGSWASAILQRDDAGRRAMSRSTAVLLRRLGSAAPTGIEFLGGLGALIGDDEAKAAGLFFDEGTPGQDETTSSPDTVLSPLDAAALADSSLPQTEVRPAVYLGFPTGEVVVLGSSSETLPTGRSASWRHGHWRIT